MRTALYSSVDSVLATEGDKLFQCGIVRGGGGRIFQGITVCLVSAVFSTVWWPSSFQSVSRGHILVFFNRHCFTMNLVKVKQGCLKRWPFKLIKHFADTTLVSPSPAGPAGCCYIPFLSNYFDFWPFDSEENMFTFFLDEVKSNPT